MSDTVSIIVPTLNEEEHIEALIDGAYNQRYRPLELILVDGGSIDKTLEIIMNLQSKYNMEDFEVKLLNERDFGTHTSAGNARNIGIRNSRGSNIMLIDSDTMFIEKDSILKIKQELEHVDYCSFKIKPLIDTKLEHFIAMDSPEFAAGCYRKDVFEKEMFNPELGYGEDADFWHRTKINLNYVCNTTLGRHYPHTLQEFKKQCQWYGRTFLKYLRIAYNEDRERFYKELFSLGSMGLYVVFVPLIVTLLYFRFFSGVLLLIMPHMILVLYRFKRSPDKSFNRFLYLFGKPMFYSYYFYIGIIESVTGKRKASRD